MPCMVLGTENTMLKQLDPQFMMHLVTIQGARTQVFKCAERAEERTLCCLRETKTAPELKDIWAGVWRRIGTTQSVHEGWGVKKALDEERKIARINSRRKEYAHSMVRNPVKRHRTDLDVYTLGRARSWRDMHTRQKLLDFILEEAKSPLCHQIRQLHGQICGEWTEWK